MKLLLDKDTEPRPEEEVKVSLWRVVGKKYHAVKVLCSGHGPLVYIDTEDGHVWINPAVAKSMGLRIATGRYPR